MNEKGTIIFDRVDRTQMNRIQTEGKKDGSDITTLLTPNKPVDQIATSFALSIPTMLIPPPLSILTNLIYSMYM